MAEAGIVPRSNVRLVSHAGPAPWRGRDEVRRAGAARSERRRVSLFAIGACSSGFVRVSRDTDIGETDKCAREKQDERDRDRRGGGRRPAGRGPAAGGGGGAAGGRARRGGRGEH